MWGPGYCRLIFSLIPDLGSVRMPDPMYRAVAHPSVQGRHVQPTHHLNNNIPVNTEVLWGGGLWWGLRAGAPTVDHGEDVHDTDLPIAIDVAGADLGATSVLTGHVVAGIAA